MFVTRQDVFVVQDSLGGNAKTVMVANISPAATCVKETASTLGFAQRAKMIKNKVPRCKTLHLLAHILYLIHSNSTTAYMVYHIYIYYSIYHYIRYMYTYMLYVLFVD